MRNELDRLHLAIDVLDRVERLHDITAYKRQLFRNMLVHRRNYIRQRGEEVPEIRNWTWPY